MSSSTFEMMSYYLTLCLKLSEISLKLLYMRKFLCKCVCLLVLHTKTTKTIRLLMVTDNTPWVNIINMLFILPKKSMVQAGFIKKPNLPAQSQG